MMWNEIQSIFEKSNKKICIYAGVESRGMFELKTLGVQKNKYLEAVVKYTAGICIDNWIRVLGQSSVEHFGILEYNSKRAGIEVVTTNEMIIVAQDMVGGVYAIDYGGINGQKKIWYFAPDTLEWECLEMDYKDFLIWLIHGNTKDFYENMRWETWEKDCMDIQFDYGYLIYPFLWSAECDLNTAIKKVVPIMELFNLNMEHYLSL